MFKNYIKIALRSLLKNKLQTGINLLGLTAGTVCCLSILVYVLAQFGYDVHHNDAESLYRIRTVIKSNIDTGASLNAATSSPPIAFALKEDFPEVIEACRVVYFGEGNEGVLGVQGKNDRYYESRGYVADATFFELFNYSFKEGNGIGALKQPNTIVLSSKLAHKLFGAESALNKNLVLGGGEDQMILKVTGVFDENSVKSHLNPNYVLTMNSPGLGEFVRNEQNFATQNFVHSYVKLLSGSNSKELEGKLSSFIQTRGAKNLDEAGFSKELFLQKVKDIHLYSKGIGNQIDTVSNIQYLYLLLILALFIQLTACVNFINLSTARANKRAKEIGVRKTVGANKGVLIRQFLGESVLLSFLALLISFPITVLVLPFVNLLTNGNVHYLELFDTKIVLPMLALSVVSGLFAGVYPALILSSVKPVKVLKGAMNVSSGSGNFRRALVIFQFVVTIGLITTVMIVNQQIAYSQNKNLGYTKENVIAIHMGTNDARRNFEALRPQIESITGIKEVSGSNHYPSEHVLGDIAMYLPGGDPSKLTLVQYNGVSDNYFNTVETKLLKGRDLRANDSTQIVVNKATLDAFNIDLDNALASRLLQTYEGETTEYEIVGVVADYHFKSLKEAITPMMLFHENTPDWVIVKTDTKDFKTLLTSLEKTWKSVNPTVPFKYTFVDNEVRKLFEEEKRLSQISMVFTGLAILISCLGLFGLISFMAEQKKKEIGIRKVLGASVTTVVNMLAKDFVKLIGIALIIASPITYYYLENWLEGFAYRVSINWWVFLVAGGITIIITLLTVGVQALKAATANPVKSLRTE
ncbi:FtsX-like permease family protein [Aquimarina sp. 2201CG1-2-11]|uniref:ABC transporter permease n=1 Tax=Aquimarina discodermiae TaxID=3231043 RepID=UPI003463772D